MAVGGIQKEHTWFAVVVRLSDDFLEQMQQLKKIGFTEARDFGPEEASKLYFTGRTDELSPSALGSLSSSILRIAHLMKARV